MSASLSRSNKYFLLIFVSVKKKPEVRVPPIDCMMDSRKQKSETIKSNISNFEDYNTPPESPGLNSASLSLSSKVETSCSTEYGFDSKSKENDEQSQPPIPPPRTRRVLAINQTKNKLKELHIAAESLEIVANELVNIGESLDVSSSSAPHNGDEI